ncbi:MAG TPA: class I SAM-dependent methyltransferase [Dongiaceae bacterium]|nr:class I SAM-dependent methyltransferase [Dongiaceae bacterium]
MSTPIEPVIAQDIWSHYAISFSRITTRHQSALYRDVAALAQGSVMDFGCGPAKLAPYLASNTAVTRYQGIDACPLMIQLGQQLLDEMADSRFAILQSSIEALPDGACDFGVSINSYYAWKDPTVVLEKINDCLAAGADFILATPNARLDMDRLMQDTWPDFLLNPDFSKFRQCNDQLAQNGAQNFVSIDTLISQLRSAGFEILNCHGRYFDGGLSYVHAKKGHIRKREVGGH